MRSLSLISVIKLFIFGLVLAIHPLVPQNSLHTLKTESDTYAQLLNSSKAYFQLQESSSFKTEFSLKSPLILSAEIEYKPIALCTATELTKINLRSEFVLVTYINPRAPPLS